MKVSNQSLTFLLRSKLGFGFLVLYLASNACHAMTPAVRIVSGANQQTTYASAFPAPLTVWVHDQFSQHPMVGARVNFKPGAGIRLSATTAVTDSRGLASVRATGLTVGASNVTAELAGHPEVQVFFGDLLVGRAPLYVVPSDLQGQVGEVPNITSYTLQGFVNGENEDTAKVTGTPRLTTIATSDSPDANYAIKGGVGTLSAPNYTFVPAFATLVLVGNRKSSQAADNEIHDQLSSPVNPIHATDAFHLDAWPGESKGDVRKALSGESAAAQPNGIPPTATIKPVLNLSTDSSNENSSAKVVRKALSYQLASSSVRLAASHPVGLGNTSQSQSLQGSAGKTGAKQVYTGCFADTTPTACK